MNPDHLASIQLAVTVPFATIHYDDTGSNVTYAILCHDVRNGIKWIVKRRFNDFKVLHSHVGRHVPESSDIFPSSGGFFRARTNTSRAAIEKRRAEIDRYMSAMVGSLLQRTSAKQQRLCQPLILKLLQFVEYPEWEDDDTNSNAMGPTGVPAGEPTIAQFWRQDNNSNKDDDAKSDASASFFAVSSFVEEAFNAQSPEMEIASASGGGSSSAGGPSNPMSGAASATGSHASSNAEDANLMSLTALSTVTTYWAAPDTVRGSKIAVEIPDVACQPTVDGDFVVTVRHNVRAPRGDVRRKYDEMLYVLSRMFSVDTVPTPTLMREIILQFRRQNPKRQYARSSAQLRRDAVDDLNNTSGGNGGDPLNSSGPLSSDGLVMDDTINDSVVGGGGVAAGAVRIGGAFGASGRGLVDDTGNTVAFASPPARGALADGRVSQLPSTFGGGVGPAGGMRICRTVPRVSNSSHFVQQQSANGEPVVAGSGATVPYRECRCSELAFCASGKIDHLQTPCGFTLIVEPTTQANWTG